MLRIDPEEGDEDGEAKPAAKLKIDQNLFTYSNAKPMNSNHPPAMQPPHYAAAPVNAGYFPPGVNNYGAPLYQQASSQYAVVSHSPMKVSRRRL